MFAPAHVMLLRALAFFDWQSDASYGLRSGDIA
jgi:hypothetical protein